MSAQNFLRRRPKSILKRPLPLRLHSNTIVTQRTSPAPLSNLNPATSRSSQKSSSRSPHVHFPPFALMTSTYTTHSPGTYDRAAIEVSPNPLEMPDRGSRVYSPTVGSFVCKAPDSSSSPSPPNQMTFIVSPLPLLSPDLIKETENTRNRLRLRLGEEREPMALSKALKGYPRSPYPTARVQSTEHTPVGSTHPRSNTFDGVFSPTRASATFQDSPTTALNQAFWKAVSLDEEYEHEYLYNTTPTPSSAGFSSYSLWSPGLPVKKTKGGRAKNVTEDDEIHLVNVKSPAPVGDRSARLPSISTVLSKFGHRRYTQLKD